MSMKSSRVLVRSWKWTKIKKIHPDGQWWWLEMIPHIFDANICSLSLSLITTNVIILDVVIWKAFVVDIVIVLVIVIVAAIDHSCDLGLPMEVTRATQRRWHISLYFCPPCSFLPQWRHIIMMVMDKKAKEMDEIIFTTNIRGMWL